jgi:hypothetical protein
MQLVCTVSASDFACILGSVLRAVLKEPHTLFVRRIVCVKINSTLAF